MFLKDILGLSEENYEILFMWVENVLDLSIIQNAMNYFYTKDICCNNTLIGNY